MYGNEVPAPDDLREGLLGQVAAAESDLRRAAESPAAGTFDAVIAADQKIEPRDAMPEAYRRSLIKAL